MGTTQINRAEFLKVSVIGMCAVCLSACARPSGAPLAYWKANQAQLLKDYKAFEHPLFAQVVQAFSEKEAKAMLAETRLGYIDLLPQVPDIGGDANSLTFTLYQSAIALAFYRVMQAHGKSLEDTGRILYRVMETLFGKPDPLGGADTRIAGGKLMQDQMRREAELSQQRKYPADWVFSFVEGEGKDFTWGIDYSECGIVKFYRAQAASALAPYLCLGDIPISRAYDTGLVRTTSLARQGTRCDFRFKPGRPVQVEWQPDFLQEGD